MLFVEVVARDNLVGILLTEFYRALGVAFEAHAYRDTLQIGKGKYTITNAEYQKILAKGHILGNVGQGKTIISKFF